MVEDDIHEKDYPTGQSSGLNAVLVPSEVKIQPVWEQKVLFFFFLYSMSVTVNMGQVHFCWNNGTVKVGSRNKQATGLWMEINTEIASRLERNLV